MTCFWDGILQSLDTNDFNKVGFTKMQIKPFIEFLKSKNTKHIAITWNNQTLSIKQCEENYQHISNYNINSIYGGYDCSGCDPFLILVTHIFSLDTCHNYMGHKIHYKSTNTIRKHVNYGSNHGHFYFISCNPIDNPRQSVRPTITQSTRPSVRPTITQPTRPSVRPTTQQSVRPTITQSTRPSVRPLTSQHIKQNNTHQTNKMVLNNNIVKFLQNRRGPPGKRLFIKQY